MDVYECSGIRMASEVPLSAAKWPHIDPADIDVQVELGDVVSPALERPSEEVIAELLIDGYPSYTFCRVEDGYVGRLPGVADFVIDKDLRRVICHPAADGRHEIIPIVITGTLTAFLLAMSGRFVLHGSAVGIGSRAVSFVGVSGQGKSTMAALFCLAGAPLITDDVLPLDFESATVGLETVYCLRAGREIRIREKLAVLADDFVGRATVRTTADGRLAVEPAASELGRVPLAAVVLPRPDREHTEVRARQLGEGEASLSLGRYQRIEGWRSRDHLRQQFLDSGRVAASVPVFEVLVPWGPPFAADLAERVLSACGIEGIG
jgi:hypothetical protein